jgi:hypothetical protein
MLNSPSIVYGLVLVLSAGGLWGILRAGSTLSASADISGPWQIVDGPLGPAPGGPDSLGDSFVVEQSGRFARIRFARGRVLDLKATILPTGEIAGPTDVAFAGNGVVLKMNIRPDEQGMLWADATLQTHRRSVSFLAHRSAEALNPSDSPAGTGDSADTTGPAASAGPPPDDPTPPSPLPRKLPPASSSTPALADGD